MGTASHNSGVCEMLQKCLVHFCTENYAATADIEIDAIICLSVVNSSQQNVIKVHEVLPKQCFKNRNNSTFFMTASRNTKVKHSLQMQLKKKKNRFSRQGHNVKKKLLLSHTSKETPGKCLEPVFSKQQNGSDHSPLSDDHVQEGDESGLSPAVRDKISVYNTDCDLSCEVSEYLQGSGNDVKTYNSPSNLEKESDRSVCIVNIKSEPDDSNWLEENSFNKGDQNSHCQDYVRKQAKMNKQRRSSGACLMEREQRTTASPLKEISSPDSLDKMYITIETEQSPENFCGTHKEHATAHRDGQDSVSHESQSFDYVLIDSSSHSNQHYILEEACLQSPEPGIKQEPVSPRDQTIDTSYGSFQQSVPYTRASENVSDFEMQKETLSLRNSEKYNSSEDDGNEYGQFRRTAITLDDQQDWTSTKSKDNRLEDPSDSILINSDKGLSIRQSCDSPNSKINSDNDSEKLQHFLGSRDSESTQYVSSNFSAEPNSSLSTVTDSATPSSRVDMSQYGDGLSLIKWKAEHSPTQQKKFFCEKCGTGFMSKKSKIRHVRHTCGSNTFQCSICGKTYSRSDSKQRHMWKMHGLKIQSHNHFLYPTPQLHGGHDESNSECNSSLSYSQMQVD